MKCFDCPAALFCVTVQHTELYMCSKCFRVMYVGFPSFPDDGNNAAKTGTKPGYAYSRETGSRVDRVLPDSELDGIVSSEFANHLRDCAYRHDDPTRPFRQGGLMRRIFSDEQCSRCREREE